MVDMTSIGIVANSLNAAVNITKAMIDLRDWSTVQSKVIELQRTILEAQSGVFAANDERSALIQRVGDLEKELTALKAWDAEKQRYELREVSPDVLAYVLKAGMENGEPFQMLCANCYQQGEKSFLQGTQELRMRRRVHVCPRCKAEYEMKYVERPEPPPINRGPLGGPLATSRRG